MFFKNIYIIRLFVPKQVTRIESKSSLPRTYYLLLMGNAIGAPKEARVSQNERRRKFGNDGAMVAQLQGNLSTISARLVHMEARVSSESVANEEAMRGVKKTLDIARRDALLEKERCWKARDRCTRFEASLVGCRKELAYLTKNKDDEISHLRESLAELRKDKVALTQQRNAIRDDKKECDDMINNFRASEASLKAELLEQRRRVASLQSANKSLATDIGWSQSSAATNKAVLERVLRRAIDPKFVSKLVLTVCGTDVPSHTITRITRLTTKVLALFREHAPVDDGVIIGADGTSLPPVKPGRVPCPGSMRNGIMSFVGSDVLPKIFDRSGAGV